MDHVKKKLLKTRHKTSVQGEEINNEDRQIVVRVGQEEKLVCGLTKHTTSKDVVEALLEEYHVLAKTNNVLFASGKEYCIMESWKSFKRILPPSLKMLKLLKSWGSEEINVRFFLLKTCTLYPWTMWWTSQRNIAPNNCWIQHNTAFHVKDFPLNMRKRIVRKAYRKLEKMKKDIDCPKENNIQQLIQLIMYQDNIIKQQMDRMKQLDNQLEAYDPCQQKLEILGCNGENVSSCMKVGDHSADRFPEMHSLENLMQIQEKLNHQNILIRKLTDEIKVEVSSMGTQENVDFVEEGYPNMVTRVKQEIEESLQVGLQLHSLYSYIQKEIQYNDSILLQKKKEYEILKDDLKSVCAGNSSSALCYTPQQYMSSSDESNSKAVCEIAVLLSSIEEQNDTDSDTGISSTHSQDSEFIH